VCRARPGARWASAVEQERSVTPGVAASWTPSAARRVRATRRRPRAPVVSLALPMRAAEPVRALRTAAVASASSAPRGPRRATAAAARSWPASDFRRDRRARATGCAAARSATRRRAPATEVV
jgi:hypothetical protein